MVDCAELGDEIAGLAGRLNAGTHQLLWRIRQFDQLDGWYEQGAQSCAHWLTWRIGLDPGAAREKVRVARALGELPKIDAAFGAGKLSYSKVRAITRIATPANEETVLEVALAATGAQLERICRGFRRATEDEVEASRDRYVRARPLGNGLVKLEIVVAADEADMLLKAIEHTREELSPADHSLPRPSAADAIVKMANLQLAGGEVSTGAPAPDRCQVVIHVDRDLASDGTLRAELEDGTHVSAETLRRVACDGGIVAAAVDESGEVLDIGRRRRAIPPAIRRALWIRDQGCRFPGCANERFLHGHHVQHWLHGGRTSLDNLVMLCSFHHRQIHEGGFSIKLAANGHVEVRAPGGAFLAAASKAPDDAGGILWQSDPGEAHIATPTWDGDPVDYDWVVRTLVAG